MVVREHSHDGNDRKTRTSLDIRSPYHSLSYKLHIIGLVDDKRQYANNWKDNSEKNNMR